jgi:hypothetical protein
MKGERDDDDRLEDRQSVDGNSSDTKPAKHQYNP